MARPLPIEIVVLVAISIHISKHSFIIFQSPKIPDYLVRPRFSTKSTYLKIAKLLKIEIVKEIIREIIKRNDYKKNRVIKKK